MQQQHLKRWAVIGKNRKLRGTIAQISGKPNEQIEIRVQERHISEQKIEEALRYSEEQFRIALKNSPIIVFNQDTDLRYTWIYNPALGFNTSEVVGKFDFDLFMPEDAKKLVAIKQEVLITGVGTRQEVAIVYNNDIKYYDLSVEPLRNLDHKIVGVTCAALDITPHKKVEQNLQESQRFTHKIADFTPNIIYIYDIIEDRNIYSNREIANILGYTPKEIQKMGSSMFKNLAHPDDFTKILDNYKRLERVKDGEILETEYRMKHANGQWRWLYSWDTIFTKTVDGKPKQIIGTASDITARKLAEETLQQQIERERLIGAISQRIRQSLNLDTILNTTVEEVQQLLKADRVLVYQILPDREGSVIAEAVASGWSKIKNIIFPAETLPQDCYQAYTLGKVYVLPDREQGGILPCMVDFMQEFSIRAKLVIPIIQKDILWGLLITHQCTAPRQWQAWEIELLQELANQLAIAIQQSQLYEQLRQNNDILAATNAELARATRLKDEFLANMSHELRTPLNAILGMSEGLLDEHYCGSLSDRQRKAIVTIERSGRHLLELINDILDLAKIESGKLKLQIAPVSTSRLIESSLTFVRQQAHQKNIKLSVKVPKEIGVIEVDELRMRQVLINLLSNAVKFTLPGGNVAVEVAAHPEDLAISFSAIDTGIGISPENMGKLFQSFVQIDSSLSRRYQGTGLGLALVRRIVELHQGSVSVESEVGKGSRFTVVIPILREKVETAAEHPLSGTSCSLSIKND